jgi:hypothetical protein
MLAWPAQEKVSRVACRQAATAVTVEIADHADQEVIRRLVHHDNHKLKGFNN